MLQGDNNPSPDIFTPTGEDILGEAVLPVPDLGRWLLIARTVLLTPPFPNLLALVVFLAFALPDRKPGETETDAAEGKDRAEEPALL